MPMAETKRKKILAIDDEASVCDMYEQCLPRIGYDVTCVSSGKKAKDFLSRSIPDIIIMDIMMPDQDGISLTREILSSPKTSHIPIVVVSGLSDAATLNDALLFGAIDYLVKPFEVETLQIKLERALAISAKHKPPR